MADIVPKAITKLALRDNVKYQTLTAEHRDVLAKLTTFSTTRSRPPSMILDLAAETPWRRLRCARLLLPPSLVRHLFARPVQLEQAVDSRIGGYVATLQMRLSRLLADGRYDFITRIEEHEDPLGAYLKSLMGVDPTGGDPAGSDWPAAEAPPVARARPTGPGPP